MAGYHSLKNKNQKKLAMALEQRFMFDAAGVATGAEVAEQHAIDAEAKAVQSSAQDAQESRQDIYFIDSSVGNYQQLIDGLENGAEYHVLDSTSNGVDQIADIVNGRTDIAGIHVLSHGSEGAVFLGNTTLNTTTLEQNRDALEIIGQSLSKDGDILLYGCNVGTSDTGQAFIENIAGATGADVAASDDLTGKGGDWILETSTGVIESELRINDTTLAAYEGVLASFDMSGMSGSTTLTKTVDTITVSITSTGGVGSGADLSGVGGINGDSVYTTGAGSMTISFDKAVNVTSFRFVNSDGSAQTLIVTPNTGGSYTAPSSVGQFSGTDITPGLTGITSMVLTFQSGADFQGAIDDLSVTAAPTDPTITSATYDAAAGTLVVTGTNLQANAGGADIDASKFTITGEGEEIHVLNNGTANVELGGSTTQFTLTLSAADKAALDQIMNKNGTESTNATPYNVAVADGWNTNVSGANDLTGNTVTVSNVAVPQITSATYDIATNQLVVTGTNFLKRDGATNDIDVSKLTFKGEGDGEHVLTSTSSVEITDGTTFTVTLSATDAAGVEALMSKNGTESADGKIYNLAAAEDWAAGADSAVTTVDGTSGVTVSNYNPPIITAVTYNYNTNQLVVTGTNFVAKAGASNDIDVSKLSLTGEGGTAYPLTSASDVEIDSATQFTITLSGADLVNVESILNQNGTTSALSGDTFNLDAAEDWMTGAFESVDIVSATNVVTVSNYAVPEITDAAYDMATGVVTLIGTNFVGVSGATNDITVADKFTFTGEDGETYTLSDTANVDVSSGTTASFTLSATDQAALASLMTKNGTSADSGQIYNLEAAEDWMAGAPAANDVVDATTGITVSNYAAPTITGATYDAAAGTLVVTGTNLQANAGGADIDASKFTITGEGGEIHVLNNGTANVELGGSTTQFTLTLSAADKAALDQIMNKNGTESTNATPYNVAVADGWNTNVSGANDLTGNTVTVSNVAVPEITGATYDIATNQLVVTGTNFLKRDGATNDIDVSKLTFKGEGDGEHVLTSTSSVEITDGTTFTVTLSATDAAGVEALMSKNGTESADGKIYNLAAAEDWAAGADSAVTTVDGTSGVTVSNYNPPVITAVTYNYNTNQLVVTGTNFVAKAGASNDIDVSKLSLTGEGGTVYPLTSASDVEIDSATQFTITLSGADLVNVESILNQNGTTSALSGDTFNLDAAEDWMTGAFESVDIVSATNVVTVSNYAVPEITDATYDWSTGQLVLVGTNFVGASGANNDIDVTKLIITGEEGATYELTSSNVDVSSDTTATVTLNDLDKLAVHGLLNKNGTSSDGSTTYNVAAADNWATGAPAANDIADATTGITVSNYAAPTITEATYNSDTGILTVTGTNFVSKSGANNDIDVSLLTFTGGTSNAIYRLSSVSDVEITSATSFSVTLSGADKTNVDALLDQIGTSSSAGSIYNIAAADNWLAGAPGTPIVEDLTSNAVTVSVAPKVTSATYDAAAGTLVVTGTNFQAKVGATNDIDASKFTITGEGGETYTLNNGTANVEIDSTTQFTLTLSAADKAALDQIMNKNGTESTNATAYNMAVADGWNTNVSGANDLTGNTVTVSNVAAPEITGATYDIATNQLVVTGTNFLKRDGAANDIDISKLTITGEGGATYTLTSASDVEITNGTTFTITLSAADAAGVEALTSKNGTSAASGTTYNLAAAEDWAVGADSAVTTVDGTSGVTVSNYNAPAIASVTYDFATGTLTLTGTNFVSKTGAANDIDVSLLSLSGQGNAAYTLTDSADVEITSATSAAITLSAPDKLAVNGLLNKDGTTSATGGTTFNLGAADNWMTGAFASVDIVDATNVVTVSNYAAPEITSATYDITTKTLVVSGSNFVNKNGAANDVDVSQLTLTGKGGASNAYTLTSATDVEITSATEFTLVLNETDAVAVVGLLDANGTSATDGQTYNLAAAGSWLAQLPIDISDSIGNGITVSNVPTSSGSSGLNVSQIGGDEGGFEDRAGNEGNTNSNDGNGPVDNGAGNVNVPAGEVNFGNSGDRTTWNEVVSRGGSSSSVIGDPSAGVEGMTIVRNAVTGNDAALNSFYGTGRVSGSATGGRAGGGTGSIGTANPGLSGLVGSGGGGLNGIANGVGGGLGGGLGGGFGGAPAGDIGLGGVGDAGLPGAGVGEPAGGGNDVPTGEEPLLGDETAPGGEQALWAPQGGRMNFSAQLANASGTNHLKIVKAILEAV